MPILEFPLDLPSVTRGALWEFHRDPAALERLTPPEKKIRVVERPLDMHGGARVVFRVRQFGLWLTWISLIEVWEPDPGNFRPSSGSNPRGDRCDACPDSRLRRLSRRGIACENGRRDSHGGLGSPPSGRA